MKIRNVWLVSCLLGAVDLFAQSQIYLLPANSWDSNHTHQVVWNTEPGVRYELLASLNITNWFTIQGYPTQAAQYADAFAFDAAIAPNAAFFKVVEYDEQPPAFFNLIPYDGAFAVPRFNSPISLSLSDVSGVDPSSISMTVNNLGTFTVSSNELSFTNGVLTFDMGGDTALGPYGTNVQVSLVAADVNGYVATNSWSFDLELEPDVATNLFVFGSPEAQRSGQQIGAIPTRVLAERAAGGPIRMAAGADPWEIQSVETNLIVISYTSASAPPFEVDEYLANLTPATVDEIFYRQVTSLSDDPGSKLLTLFTQDVLLTDMVEEGTAAITEESFILEASTNGTITKAVAFDFTVPLPNIGYSLDGQTFSVSDGGPVGLEIVAEECHFWLSPRLETSLEIKLSGLERFSAIARGDIDSALVCDVTAQAGTSYDKTIYDLPTSAQPKTFVTLGAIGVPPFAVPVIAEVGVDLKLDVDMYADAGMNFRYGFRQEIETAFGVRYVKDNDLEWVKDFIPAETDRIPFTSTINGELGLGLTLRPSIYVIVYKLAGIETGPAVRGGVRFENDGTELAGYLEGRADWELGLAGPAFAFLNTEPLSLNIWPPVSWQLFPDADHLTFIDQPDTQIATLGGSAYFSCSVSSDQGVEYQWYQNGTRQLGQTGRTLTRYPVTYGHAGTYKVTATAGGEPVESDPAILTVSELPSDGLIAYYPFDGDAKDYSGNENHADIYGSPSFADNYLKLYDNTSNYLSLPNSLIDGRTSFSISARVRLDAVNGDVNTFLSGANLGEFNEFLFTYVYWPSAGDPHWVLSHIYPFNYYLSYDRRIEDLNWHLITLTFDGVMIKFYQDGVLQELNQSNESSWNISPGGLIIGQEQDSFGGSFEIDQNWQGGIDDLRFYNRALSPSEVQQLYQQGQ